MGYGKESKISGLFEDCMHKNNVTPVVHNKNSIVFDAGAKLIDYDD